MENLLKEILNKCTFKWNNIIIEKTPFIYKNNLIFTIQKVIEKKRWVNKNKIIYRFVKCYTEIGNITFIVKLVNNQIIKQIYMPQHLIIFLNNQYNFTKDK